MEDHKIKGNFCKKYWNDEKERTISFPSKIAELSALAKTGIIKIDGKDFKVSEESLCQWAYRGFSLQHQGAEPMSEEEKAKAKKLRKEANEVIAKTKEWTPEEKAALIAEINARELARKQAAK